MDLLLAYGIYAFFYLIGVLLLAGIVYWMFGIGRIHKRQAAIMNLLAEIALTEGVDPEKVKKIKLLLHSY